MNKLTKIAMLVSTSIAPTLCLAANPANQAYAEQQVAETRTFLEAELASISAGVPGPTGPAGVPGAQGAQGATGAAGTNAFPTTTTTGLVMTSDGTNRYWNTQTGPVYSVGQAAFGGIVFWVDDSGKHGLVASLVDQGSAHAWGLDATNYSGSFSDGMYAGFSNQVKSLIRQSMSGSDPANRVMGDCAAYVVAESGINIDGWYAPAPAEFYQMYLQNAAIVAGAGTTVVGKDYWTSLEDVTNPANAIRFLGASTNQFAAANKSSSLNFVRCIKAF